MLTVVEPARDPELVRAVFEFPPDRGRSVPEVELLMGDREGCARAQVGPAMVALPAELTVANAWSVGVKLDSAFAPGITTVIVDLTATTSCDSSGVAVLALAHGKAVAYNVELRLVAPSAMVRHVLALAGLDRVLRIFPSLDEALAAAPMPERLAEMEQVYESWIAEFSESSGFSPALVVPDPARAVPGEFRVFATGSALLCFADDLSAFCSSWPEGLSEEHEGLISAFFGVLRDWITTRAEPDVSSVLDEQVKELTNDGFAVLARERFLLLTGGIDAKPFSWRIVDIKVQSAVLI